MADIQLIPLDHVTNDIMTTNRNTLVKEGVLSKKINHIIMPERAFILNFANK